MKAVRVIVIALLFAATSLRAIAEDYSDLWWYPNEPGWGLIIIDHETDLFVVWCTYDANGNATWYVIPGGTFSLDRLLFTGDLYATRAFGDSEYTWIEATRVGQATIDFGLNSELSPPPPGFARFDLRRTGGPANFTETRYVTRQPFGSGQGSRAGGGTDMWWNPEWPGHGLATIQHGHDDMFGVWLTYGNFGLPTFYVTPAGRNERQFPLTVSHQFIGPVYRTQARGAHGTFDPTSVSVTNAGSAWLTFFDDTSRMELYLGGGAGGIVPLTRLPFGAISSSVASGR